MVLTLAIKEDEALMLFVLGSAFAWGARVRGDAILARFAALTALAGALTLIAYFFVLSAARRRPRHVVRADLHHQRRRLSDRHRSGARAR